MKNAVRVWASIFVVTSLAMAGLSAARADDQPHNLDNPAFLIDSLAPDKVTASSLSAHIETTRIGSAHEGGPSVSIVDGSASTSLKLSSALAFDNAVDDVHVFTQADGEFAAYVKGTPNGGQVYFAVTNPRFLTDLFVEFPLDEGAELVPAPTSTGGSAMVELEDGRVIILAEPWARAADGENLVTSYRLDGDRLVQEIVTTPATAYPILADPAWQYALKYDIGVRSPFSIRSTLHTCFNCKFPISGAPSGFPVVNQLLPLTVGGIGNFECRMGLETLIDEPVWVSYDYFFNATANHVDGAGSGISFSFQFFPGDSTYSMVVSAYIVNDFGGPVGQAIYTAGAAAQWAAFANNLYISP